MILEKILDLSSFTCQFTPICKKGPFESLELRSHLNKCYARPIKCFFCQNFIPFQEYFDHLQINHRMKESLLDKETIIINFTQGKCETNQNT